jgi:class 3 adenylate cyclase
MIYWYGILFVVWWLGSWSGAIAQSRSIVVARVETPSSTSATRTEPIPQTNAARIDSLKRLLSSDLPDTNRVITLIDFARELWSNNPRQARSYAFEALGISERVGFMRGIANADNTIGVTYFYQGWYDIALEYYQKSLTLRQTLGDKKGVASSLNNIGLIYNAQQKYDDALKYLQQALAAYKEIKANNSIATAYNNIGITYRKKKLLDTAEIMHRAALQTLEGTRNAAGLALTYNSLGILRQEQGDNANALEYQQKALTLYEQSNNRKGLIDAHIGSARALLQLGRTEQALRSLDKAMVFAQGLNARTELRDCYELLAHIEERIGNISGAYYNFRRYEALKDSLFSEEADTKSAQFDAKYDAELRAKQIALLTAEQSRQTLLRNVLIGAVLAAILGAGLLYNRYRLKHRSEAALQAMNTELSTKNVLIEQARFMAEQLLLNVLPKPIAERMQAGEQRIAERFSEVTVLFADIVDFTQLSSSVPPEELVTLLDAVFSDFDALAERYGLEKIKTIGDAYMAVCGVPVPQQDHAERVATFALEIQRAVKRYNVDKPNGESEPLSLRIGIHCGDVVAGVIGKKKFSYDLWGDTVNIASRLQSHGKVGEIQCSEQMYEILREKCIFEHRGHIELKGSASIEAYLLKSFVRS